MSWRRLQDERRVQRHVTTRTELDDLRSVVRRDLADAGIEALSADRRFATAYNAVLQLSKMVIACAGYRVTGIGHHHTTFEAVELAMGEPVAPFVTYFDACRRKRNTVDYDVADVATETEAQELIERAESYRAQVEGWIRANHPDFAAAD